ncbi:MAG: response regulator transcription factor [Tepidanaerobacter acetatoxydans]|uniref:response regulator n=1 Tax=Tepidanaerobacter acetatoxydans TaxID=499229 RepID=UPI0026F166A6|nr:response regulator transcription factor [Tepidanaerobacter acetatoxydans]NLU10165.1 response regulator transcription factor [Tepidanaerobacter acetatoxydans]
MSRGKILVVDDEVNILELLEFNLENAGFDVLTCDNGEDALKLAKTNNLDLIILDLMLPGLDGFEVCKLLKKDEDTYDIPIIMLTAKSDETDKVIGLELGADDYITKPFGIREIIARIRVILRRVDGTRPDMPNIIKIGDIIIDSDRHIVKKQGELIELTLREFRLLEVLAQNQGNVVSRDFLLNEVWGNDYLEDSRTIDVHIRKLRKKLEDDPEFPKYIETIRGVGYKMK